MISKPELLLDSRSDLGEGPAWSSSSRLLYWVDIHRGILHLFNPQELADRQFDVGECLGCLAPRAHGGLILGLRSGFGLLESSAFTQPASTPLEMQRLSSPESALPGNRFNDGKADPAGRFLAGSMDDAEVAASGSLYSLSQTGALTVLLGGLRISNGLAWSPDQRTFYHIDSPTHNVMAYDYDCGSGLVANPRTVVTVPPELGWPDGMTSDIEGMLWVALWGGAALSRWNPATGRLLKLIPIPAFNVSACVFGGPDLTDLYVTSARKGMDPSQLARYPLSGGLFRLRTNIQGMPTFEYAG